MSAQQRKIEQIIQTVERLNPMPTSVTRVLKELENPDTSAQLVAELVGLDQALAAQVLQFANSAALGYGPACANLNDAVVRLGFKRIKTVMMGAAVSGPLSNRLVGYRLGAGVLFNHSVAAAMAAQWLSRTLGYVDPEEAYVAGLLHDMGKLVLDQNMQISYQHVMEAMARSNLLLWQVEERMFGLSHAAVGGLMAEKWRFPRALSDAIAHHHAPSLAYENGKLAAIINISNAFATRDEIGPTDPHGRIIHPEALDILRLTEHRIRGLFTDLEAFLKMRTG